MPPGAKPGQRFGGRQKGTPNRKTEEIAEKLARLKCDPLEGMAMIALNKVPCGLCRGAGKTKYKLPGDETIHERTCERCYGSRMEACSLELRAKMYSDLAQYVHPRRKAIELSTPSEPLELSIAAILRSRRLKRDEQAKASADGPALITCS
jgi:hypothetical protein